MNLKKSASNSLLALIVTHSFIVLVNTCNKWNINSPNVNTTTPIKRQRDNDIIDLTEDSPYKHTRSNK